MLTPSPSCASGATTAVGWMPGALRRAAVEQRGQSRQRGALVLRDDHALDPAGTAGSFAETTAATACEVDSAANASGAHGDREIGRPVGVGRMDDALDLERAVADQARRQRLCNFTHQHHCTWKRLACELKGPPPRPL